MMKTSDGAIYVKDRFGVLYHANWRDFPRREYDREYLDKYREIPAEQLERMGKLRLDVLESAIGKIEGKTVYELGYGIGYFLRQIEAAQGIPCGCDEADPGGMDIPSGGFQKKLVEEFNAPSDVFCAFDVIEHLPDLYNVLACLRSKYLYFSVPWYNTARDFETWRHRRPDEHIYHFTTATLCRVLRAFGYETIYSDNPEDAIRKGQDAGGNILTVIAIKS